MNDAPVSIVLRSFNEAWALRETLPALGLQDYRNWELIAIDSGSTDGSVDLIRAASPRHFIQIAPQDYRPGWVLNTGMRLARSAAVVFLNADATPRDANWLGPLVAALQDPRTAAVFSRQLPRPHCRAVFARDYERCFGSRQALAGRGRFFSLASSAIRRDIWGRRGFLESMQYSEDEEYARWCRDQGWNVAYCPESAVVHSHNYTPRQAYKRSFGEAWALTAMEAAPPRGFTPPHAALLGWLNDVRRDFGFCLRTGRLPEWPQAWRIRWAPRQGKLAGFLAGAAMRPKGPLS